MIRASVDSEKCRFSACGHAGYAPKGRDIVCAAVSALTGTLAACISKEAECSLRDDGAAVEIACRPSPSARAAFRVIETGLKEIENAYGDFLRVEPSERPAAMKKNQS